MKRSLHTIFGRSEATELPNREIRVEDASVMTLCHGFDTVSCHCVDTVSVSTIGYPAIKPDKISLPQIATTRTLESCKRGLGVTYSRLKVQLDDLNDRIAKMAQHEDIVTEEYSDGQSSKEELEESIKQCLDICTKATEEVAQDRVNVFEDVNMAEDGHQILVSTIGDLISAKRITAGARSIQWLGQMSDASLQQLSQKRYSDTEGTRQGAEVGAVFEGRHGTGRKLN